jgi:hypothetical protein
MSAWIGSEPDGRSTSMLAPVAAPAPRQGWYWLGGKPSNRLNIVVNAAGLS